MTRLIGLSIVRNESGRFLRRWLESMLRLVDLLIIVDDASEDDTVSICRSFGDQVLIHQFPQSLLLTHETIARSAVWEQVRRRATPGDWIVLLDADEVPSPPLIAARETIRSLPAPIQRLDTKLLELWDEHQWRCDGHWSPWFTAFLRYEDLPFHPAPASGPTLHASRLPTYAQRLTPEPLDLPVLHLGYSTLELRHAKSRFYLERNSGVNLDHARTILQPPRLKLLREQLHAPRVLLAIPIRNRAWVVPTLLQSLANICYPHELLECLFLLNDSQDETEQLLRTLSANLPFPVQLKRHSFEDPPPCGEHQWSGPLLDPRAPLRRMGKIRNRILDLFTESEADALLSIDSDVFLDPRCLAHLAATGEDIISPVFWAGWGVRLPRLTIADHPTLRDRSDIIHLETLVRQGKRPQVWQRGTYSFTPEFIADLFWRRGLHQVGGLGAVTFIRRSVVSAGVSYSQVPNLPEDMVGEDRHFCVRATCNGFDLRATSYLRTIHCDEPPECSMYYRDILSLFSGVSWPFLWAPQGESLAPNQNSHEASISANSKQHVSQG